MKTSLGFICWRVSSLLLLSVTTGHAALEAFINFGTDTSSQLAVAGESQDVKYSGSSGWMRFSLLDEGILNTISIGNGNSGAIIGKTSFTSLKLLKTLDAASPKLLSACVRGLHFNSVKLVLRSSAGVVYSAVLQTVFIQSVNWTGSNGDDTPTENVVLQYGQLQWTYIPHNNAGNSETPLSANWDVIQNSGGLGLLLGYAPTATDQIYSHSPGLSLKIKLSDIASDPSGEPLTLISLGHSAQGATLKTDNHYIFYLPLNNLADSFPYTVANDLGGSATGTIFVQVVNPAGVPQKIVSDGVNITLTFAGIPGYVYDVQYASDLNASWLTVATVTTPANGVFTFTEKSRSNPAYYRLVQHF